MGRSGLAIMHLSEERAAKLLESLGFEEVRVLSRRLGQPDLEAKLDSKRCLIKVKSLGKDGLDFVKGELSALLELNRVCAMARRRQQDSRAFVFYMDDESRYVLSEFHKANVGARPGRRTVDRVYSCSTDSFCTDELLCE